MIKFGMDDYTIQYTQPFTVRTFTVCVRMIGVRAVYFIIYFSHIEKEKKNTCYE